MLPNISLFTLQELKDEIKRREEKLQQAKDEHRNAASIWWMGQSILEKHKWIRKYYPHDEKVLASNIDINKIEDIYLLEKTIKK